MTRLKPTSCIVVAAPVQAEYDIEMSNMVADTGPIPAQETAAERKRRIAWEAERIAEARASVAAGRVVASDRVDAWIDSLDTDHPLPAPRSGR